MLALTRQAQNRLVLLRFFSKHSVFLNDSNQQSEISNQNEDKSKSNETRIAGDLLSEEMPPAKKKYLSLVSNKIYNELVVGKMFGKTLLSPNMEKKRKKEAKKVKEELASKLDPTDRRSTTETFYLAKINNPRQPSEAKDKKSKNKGKPEQKVKPESKKPLQKEVAEEETPINKESPIDILVTDYNNEQVVIINSSDSAKNPEIPGIIEAPERKVNNIIRIPYDWSLRQTCPSVSKILNVSMSDESRKVLEAWEARMIQEKGEEGFKEYKKQMFARGHALHSLLERYLLYGEPLDDKQIDDEVTKNHIRSVSNILPYIKDAQALESAVVHPQLKYSGIVDCIARIGDQLCLIDWKTSEKAKPTIASLFDNPLQVVAYLGAVSADPAYAHLKIKQGAVVVIYNTGYQANIHRFSKEQMANFWKLWIQRIKLYEERTLN